MDGSVKYGTSEQRANELRAFEGGRLITTEHDNGELLRLAPANSIEEQRVRGLAFFSGDIRANENIALTAVNTLFVREHNRIAEEILNDNPEFSDEEIFQRARKINTAIIQSITYNEFIPSLGIELEPYVSYDESINPQISHLFSVVAFRIGHSQIGEQFVLVNETDVEQTIPMHEGFFNPSIIQKHGIDSIIKGVVVTKQQASDIYYHDSIRNFETSNFNPSPNYYGYITGGGNQIAIIASIFKNALNQNNLKWNSAPGNTEIEKIVVENLAL